MIGKLFYINSISPRPEI